MKSESQKLYQRAAELEAELAKLDAQIVQLEAQAQAALAEGTDPDAIIAKAQGARSKARAIVRALAEIEPRAAKLALEENLARCRAAEASAMAVADPIRKAVRDSFAKLAAEAGKTSALGPLVTVLTGAQEAALEAIDGALKPSGDAAYEAARLPVVPAPIRDKHGRRCTITPSGELIDLATRKPGWLTEF